MSKMYTFDSKIEVPGLKLEDFSQEEVKNEPMLFNCDFHSAWELGGKITKDFLTKLEEKWDFKEENILVDTRVHMLMPGWFPCIPGFHHDDVPRSRSDGQPNYDSPEYKAEHCMALVNGAICPTEFALGKNEYTDIPLGETVYKKWHKEVEDDLREGKLESRLAVTNQLIFFDWNTWHQGTKANNNGWRWFGRASRYSGRKPTNELRRQVQCYLEFPMEGW